jgi:SagB-type dehydrogenase family enzyme
MFYFDLYHQNAKHKPDKKGTLTPITEWPEEWRTIYYKTYPRLPEIVLPNPEPITTPFSELLLKRTSSHSFTRRDISPTILSSLLFYSLGEKPGQDKRMYASAGARYPIEAYLLITRNCEALSTGIYHYNVKDHSLVQLDSQLPQPEILKSYGLDDTIHNAACTIFLTGVFTRSTMKYKERAYRYSLIEAGEITQNLALSATALGLLSLNLGGTIDTEIEDLLDVDGVEESLLHTICFS